MRFCATVRGRAASMMGLIAPVRLRLVASGLRMQKVRSLAMRAHRLVSLSAEKLSVALIPAAPPRGKPAPPLSIGVGDGHEILRGETGPADQRPIHIGNAQQFAGVGGLYRPAVEDAHGQ